MAHRGIGRLVSAKHSQLVALAALAATGSSLASVAHRGIGRLVSARRSQDELTYQVSLRVRAVKPKALYEELQQSENIA
jgi:hypothetical protein